MSVIISIVIRMGKSAILSVIHTINIATMLNFNKCNNGHGLKNVTCKQTLTVVLFVYHSKCKLFHSGEQ